MNTGTPGLRRSERILTYVGILGGIAGVVSAWVVVIQLGAYFSERDNEIRQSVYSLSASGDLLILSAREGTIPPLEVVVVPVFDVDGSSLIDAFGESPRPYSNFQLEAHIDGLAIRIPGITTDTCQVIENIDRCSDFGILGFQVFYSFGDRHKVIEDFVQLSPSPSAS